MVFSGEGRPGWHEFVIHPVKKVLSTVAAMQVDNHAELLLITAFMSSELFSVRMRAEQNGAHSSGAERIATAVALPALAAELVARALASHDCLPDAVHCTVERLVGDVLCRPLPAISTFMVTDWCAGRECAGTLLQRAGVSPVAAMATMELIASGPAPGGQVMRGAMLVDAATGERLEVDRARGVRVSRMDLVMESRAGIMAGLAASGLGHHRVAEALVLAGKVMLAPGVVAELCWSDDPGYVAGYVADPYAGYQRITSMKPVGDRHGGRALFVHSDQWERASCYAFLEQQAVLFEALGPIAQPQAWRS